VVLAGLLLVPTAVSGSVMSAPGTAGAVEPTVVSAVGLPGGLQVGQAARDVVRVSGPVGRAVQVQFRTAATRWRTATTLVTNGRHRVRVEVAVTTTGGRLVWQVERPSGLWAVAGRTSEPVGRWRVLAPAVPGWTRAVSPTERVRVVRFPLWIRRVSVSSTGTQANGWSADGALSANGRDVGFTSSASNLVISFWMLDVFVHDRLTERTTRISGSGLTPHGSRDPVLSADGRYVVFDSISGAGMWDVAVHDRVTGGTSRLNMGGCSEGSFASDVSADGRYIAFSSPCSVVGGDTNEEFDVFVHDQVSGTTSRVSVSSTGTQANGSSGGGGLSADGRYVAFGSGASNLVPGDTNGTADVFVHDRDSGVTSLVSVSSTGTQANGGSGVGGLSADGRYVVFHSYASNLVPDDTNDDFDVFVHDRDTGQTRLVAPAEAGGVSGDGRLVVLDSDWPYLVARDTNRVTDVFLARLW
jgi:hypothetical protein